MPVWIGTCSRRCGRPARRSGRWSPRCPRRRDCPPRCRCGPWARTTPPRRSSGVPAEGERFAYISCGTWSLVGRGARRAGAHRGEPAGQLHQRGGRRRHGEVPAQRHGAVAAAGVAARLGAAGRPVALDALLGEAARPAGVRADGRPRRPVIPASRRHAGAHRATRAAGPASRRRRRPRRRSGASWRVSRSRTVGWSGRRRGCPGVRSRWSTSSAAGRRNRAAVSADRRCVRAAGRGGPGRGDRARQRTGSGAGHRGDRRRAGRPAVTAAPHSTTGAVRAGGRGPVVGGGGGAGLRLTALLGS